MLTASARALWPFFVRFSAPSPGGIARGGAAAGATGSLQFAPTWYEIDMH